MIVLENVSKIFYSRHVKNVVFQDLNAVFPSRTSVALLGRNGAGKSTLLQVISGALIPNSGRVLSDGNISFPIGLANSMHPHMSGAQNTKFIARIYGADTDALTAHLQRLPLRALPYKDRTLPEFDLDAALAWGAANPECLVLLDELAHSNVAG